MKQSRLLGAVCACLLFITVAPAAQAIVYMYTGNSYTTAQSPYDLSMAVTGTLELAAALDPNLLLFTAVTPTSFSFNDGINTTTDTTATLTGSAFEFTTDSAGNITGWNINMTTFDPNATIGQVRSTQIIIENTTNIRDQAFTETCVAGTTSCIASNGANAAVPNQPGSWAVVPIPAAVWLFGSGLLGLVGMARRKRSV